MDRSDRRRWLQDGTLALLLSAMAILEVVVPLPTSLGDGSPALSATCAAVLTLVLVLRRRRPLVTVAVLSGGWALLHLTLPVLVLFWGQFIPLLVATYSVARHGAARAPLIGAACTAAGLLVLDLTVPAMGQPSEMAFHWTVAAVAWLAGWALGHLERRADAADQRATATEAAGRERTAVALVAERSRIARELHDVVAHAVTTMVVQAGAAEQVVDDDPQRARAALSTIRTTGQSALLEMRRVVTMLRTEDETAGLEPQPGMDGLADLVAATRNAGQAVELRVEGEPRALPAGLDLALYRIAQESLTNVRRHARAAHARVTVSYGADRVDLLIDDDGTGPGSRANGGIEDLVRLGGHGLIGMRERTRLYGGQFEATGRAQGGFAVRASFPVEAA